jgi:ABC-2 type transport system ATP-binding protein
MTQRALLEVEALTKHFGQLVALDGLHMTIPEASTVGLLGPNGAGKTTTVNLLATFLRPTSGSFRLMGLRPPRDSARIRRLIGLVSQDVRLYEELTGEENCLFYARMHGIPRRQAKERIERLLKSVGMYRWKDTPVKQYSTGMKGRVRLARALVHDPPLLYLDEPTVGLDAVMKHTIWEDLLALKEQGKSMLLTTHDLREAELLCDEVILLHKGKTLTAGLLKDVRAAFFQRTLVQITLKAPPPSAESLERALEEKLEASGAKVAGRVVSFELPQGPEEVEVEALQEFLRAQGLRAEEWSIRRPSLEDIYLAHFGREEL